MPKPSGVLRNYTLLDVEDQIVYQAAANIIAEKMARRVRPHYFKQVFGHLYAGKNEAWFYRKWTTGFAAFNKAAADAHAGGRVYTASFDLTAFYDSIDHHVLHHFLDDFGVNRDLIVSLKEWLSTWTGTDAQILQGHGIPQGPLSSGLLSESVLSHLDNHGWTKSGVTYLRYVDDIRLFAKTEHQLRAALIRLDHLSKDIGLFPQSSKIGIHRVSDISEELKSISQPGQMGGRRIAVDQGKLYRRLVALSPRYVVSDSTQFKFLLASAIPRAELTARLWKIVDRAPQFFDPVARYLARAERLPKRASEAVVNRIVGESLYPAVAAAYLRAVRFNLHPSVRSRARTRFKRIWSPRLLSPDLTVALGEWLLANDGISHRQCMYACSRSRSAWTRSSLIIAVGEHATDAPLRAAVAAKGIVDAAADPAVCAAAIAGSDGVRPAIAARDMKYQGALVLKEFGLVRRANGRQCGIQASLAHVLGWSPAVDWRKYFGATYRHVERKIVESRGYAGNDATAWTLGLDVFNDYLLDALFRQESGLGGYTLGRIGTFTHSPSAAFRAKYPHVLLYAKMVHDKRFESDLAHPLVRSTGQHTRRVPFQFIRKSKIWMVRALKEIENEYRR